MATTNRQSGIRLTADLSTAEQPAMQREHAAEQPFVMVILGDFQGRTRSATPGEATPLGERRLYDIDRDTFDAVLERFNAEWYDALEGLPGQPKTTVPVQTALRTVGIFSRIGWPNRLCRCGHCSKPAVAWRVLLGLRQWRLKSWHGPSTLQEKGG
jgi:hypothetical protein